MPLFIVQNDITKMQVDAIETASHFGIGADRAVNYHVDCEGTALNFAVMSEAVCSVRSNKQLSKDWKKRIDEDYHARKNNKK